MFDGRISDQVGALLLSAHASCASSTLPSTWASYRSASSAAHEQSLGACSKQHTYPVPKSSHLHAASRCRTATSPSTTLCRYSSGLCLDPTALKSALAVALLPPPGLNLLRQFPRSIQTVQKRPIGRQLPYRLTTRSCLLSRATTAIIVGRRPVQYNHPEHSRSTGLLGVAADLPVRNIPLGSLSLALSLCRTWLNSAISAPARSCSQHVYRICPGFINADLTILRYPEASFGFCLLSCTALQPVHDHDTK